MPFASQYLLSSCCGRYGCISTWLFAGTTLACSSSISRFLTEKLETPMARTLPTNLH